MIRQAANYKGLLLATIISLFFFAIYGFHLQFWIYSVFSCSMIILGIIDYRTQTVDDLHVAAGSVFLWSLHLLQGSAVQCLIDGAISAVIMLLLFSLCSIRAFCTGREAGLGSGDVVVSFLIGMGIGWANFIVVLYLTVLSMTIYAYASGREQEHLPLVPGLALFAILNCFIPGGLQTQIGGLMRCASWFAY